jgi:hypothetical protein
LGNLNGQKEGDSMNNNSINHVSKVRRSLLALLSASALMLSACNMGDTAGLKVAGGTIDGSGDAAKYPGTVYVELDAKDFSGRNHIIRNVGTLVDVGLPNSYALFLSLADVFQTSADGQAQLPIMKTVEVKLFLNNGESSITLPGVSMNGIGFMQDSKGRSYSMVTVGVKAEKAGNVDPGTASKVEDISSKIFLSSPIMVGSQNLRNANTSYIMMAIPKNAHPAINSMRAAKLMTAEERPDPSKLKGVLVGFGENTVGGSRKSDFQLAPALPSVMKRNFADIEALNKSESDQTPLRKLIGSNSAAAAQLWEITGSGLCGSSDGSNYDTGAAVYVDGRFAGFGVISTSKTSGFKGRLDCGKTSKDDMSTLIVSPSSADVAAFKKRFK